MNKLTGILLTLLSAASFGSMAIFAKLAYADGTGPSTLLFLRFLCASLLLAPWLLWRRLPLPRGRALAGLIFMGAVCYALEALAFFQALTYASAGLVSLLLYLFPALVLLLSALLFKEKITPLKLLALLLSLAGLAITVGNDLAGQPLGIVLGISAALIYSVYILIGSRVTGGTHPLAAAWVVITAAAVSNAGFVAVSGWQPPHSAAGWGAIGAITVICTVVAIASFLVGIEKIGPSAASMVSTVEPVVTLLLAWAALGETPAGKQWLGGALILACVLILAMNTRRDEAIARDLREA